MQIKFKQIIKTQSAMLDNGTYDGKQRRHAYNVLRTSEGFRPCQAILRLISSALYNDDEACPIVAGIVPSILPYSLLTKWEQS